jgi:hypothetical protein
MGEAGTGEEIGDGGNRERHWDTSEGAVEEFGKAAAEEIAHPPYVVEGEREGGDAEAKPIRGGYHLDVQEERQGEDSYPADPLEEEENAGLRFEATRHSFGHGR